MRPGAPLRTVELMEQNTKTGSKGGVMRIIAKLIAGLALALVVAALAVPAAPASLGKGGPEGGPSGAAIVPGAVGGPAVRLTGDSGGQLPRYRIGSASTVSTYSSTGFDWGDAAIGAGFAGVVVLLGGALTLVVRRRQDRLATA
jgi:hypothetical protein